MISVPLQSLPFKYSNYQYSQYGQVIRSDVFWYLTFELQAKNLIIEMLTVCSLHPQYTGRLSGQARVQTVSDGREMMFTVTVFCN